jgi:hypothetical protein
MELPGLAAALFVAALVVAVADVAIGVEAVDDEFGTRTP